MGHLATPLLRLLTWLLLNASLHVPVHVQAYSIGPSCSEYKVGGARRNLIPMLRDSMKESKTLATLGRRNIRKQEQKPDNSKHLLFREANSDHLQRVRDYYTDILEAVLWDFKPYEIYDRKDITIHCGSEDFYSEDGNLWTKEGHEHVPFTAEGHQVNGKWTLCPEETYAKAFLFREKGVAEMVVLCDILDGNDAVPMVMDRGTVERLNEIGGLELGMHFDPKLAWVISTTLLHELFHIFKRGRMLGIDQLEFIDWDQCVATPPRRITIDQAVKNPDSYAIYATTLRVIQLNPDFFWFTGVLGSRQKEREAEEHAEQGSQGTFGDSQGPS